MENVIKCIMVLIYAMFALNVISVATNRVILFQKPKGTNNIRQMKFTMVIMILVYLSGCVYGTVSGVCEYREYAWHAKNFVTIDARVMECYHFKDDDGYDRYEVYIAYEYGDKKVDYKLWDGHSTEEYDVGDEIEIRISSKNPEYVDKGRNGGDSFILSLILFALIPYVFTELLHKPLRKKESRYFVITKEMLVHDVKPKVTNMFAKISFAAGVVLVAESLFISHIFTATSAVVGMIFLIISAVLGYFVKRGIKKFNPDKVRIVLDTCLRREIEGSGEDTITVTHFSKCGRISGEVGVIGRSYYVVECDGDYANLYDCDAFTPDASYVPADDVVKKVLKSLVTDTLIMLAMCAVYVGIIYFFCR